MPDSVRCAKREKKSDATCLQRRLKKVCPHCQERRQGKLSDKAIRKTLPRVMYQAIESYTDGKPYVLAVRVVDVDRHVYTIECEAGGHEYHRTVHRDTVFPTPSAALSALVERAEKRLKHLEHVVAQARKVVEEARKAVQAKS